MNWSLATAPPNPHVQLKVVPAIAATVMLLTLVAGGAALFDLKPAESGPFSVPMSIGAVLAFLLLGLLLQLCASASPSTSELAPNKKQLPRRALAAVVILIGLLTLADYLINASAGLESMFGRMSPITSAAVLCLGTVLLLRELQLAAVLREWLALSCIVVGYLALMGYVYGAEQLYRIGASAIPVPSAICIVLIGVACLLLPPRSSLMRPILSKGPGGVLVRRLLPVALIVAPAMDVIQTRSVLGQTYMAFVGLANVALLVMLIWGTGKAVQIAHSQRRVAEKNAEAERERLQLALQAAEGGAWDLDLKRSEAWWSPEMYRLWQVSPGELIKLDGSLSLIHPADRQYVLQAVTDAIAQRVTYECEFRLVAEGASERWMASRGRVHYDASGEAARLIGISVDITSRKVAEIELRKKNRALMSSNLELQRFAQVAAHDLQTPLRGIGSFAELLNITYRDRLDDKGCEWLDRIFSSSQQLHLLIRDLLEYSNIDAQPFEARPVSLDEVLDRVLLMLAPEVQDSGCEITRDPLPTVFGEDTQLVRLLLNLLSNAIKYRTEGAPRIHFCAEQVDTQWQMSVRDNGIGIDPRHRARIFEMFERLHDADRYPGTGIGLALCRRVVERHGGSLWLESEVGEGSTFFFTLPTKV